MWVCCGLLKVICLSEQDALTAEAHVIEIYDKQELIWYVCIGRGAPQQIQ